MYMKGTITIDPSELTRIEKMKPTKAFGKMAYYLTLGLASDKEEQETFTAISILQEINKVMRSVGVTNVVRLAKDEISFFLDEDGEADDLKKAMDAFEGEVDGIESELFKTLNLVLEHHTDDMRYLIDIKINRNHEVGEHPIIIVLNGLSAQFKAHAGTDSASMRTELKPVFSSQKRYDAFLRETQAHFDQFMGEIELSIHKVMHVTELLKSSQVKIIRPKKRKETQCEIKTYDDRDPVYSGYYGFSDYFWYTWTWSDMCYSHNIYCHEIGIVDESGHDVVNIGEQGFEAGSASTLNLDEDFALPDGADVSASFQGSDYDAELESAGVLSGGDEGDGHTDGGGWFDSSGLGSGDGGGDSSCSSCSSCGGS